MSVTPRVLLSIDYEPWFALFRRYDGWADSMQRRALDDGFTLNALDPILEQLGDARASIYLVGEVAEWHPEVPQKIVAAGHELGMHCHIHRPLKSVDELAQDIRASESWRKQYGVRGYRAPMIGISEAAYPLLEANGFEYSSSIYAPGGVILQKGKVWEIPVSTARMREKEDTYTAPRDFTFKLLLNGEFPYGSSFSVGLLGNQTLKFVERELRLGRSPSIFLHPYELVKMPDSARITRDLIRHPELLPFLRDKSGYLKTLLKHFPVSTLGSYLEEYLQAKAA
jgi:peptidoglycan/xylan/chitin deacetylase (PgdA/CDA1 family)